MTVFTRIMVFEVKKKSVPKVTLDRLCISFLLRVDFPQWIMVSFVLACLSEGMLIFIQEVPLFGSRSDPENAVPSLVLE